MDSEQRLSSPLPVSELLRANLLLCRYWGSSWWREDVHCHVRGLHGRSSGPDRANTVTAIVLDKPILVPAPSTLPQVSQATLTPLFLSSSTVPLLVGSSVLQFFEAPFRATPRKSNLFPYRHHRRTDIPILGITMLGFDSLG